MSLKLITVCSHPEHAITLIESSTKNGWDLEVIKCEWKGFGTKLVETYKYLKEHPEVTEFVFCDAFDVVVLGSPEEFKSKVKAENILLSTEKGLWPPSLLPFRSMYFEHEHGFNYINSGLYYCKSSAFIIMYEEFTPFEAIDDQLWMNLMWLLNDWVVIDVDSKQSVFNNHSFIAEGEYTYNNGRVQIMGNEPVFIHCNAKTIDEKLNQMLAV